MGGSSADEFPLLSDLGLYAADIRGDGNCLFNALSDQIYGDQSEHVAIRARVIDYMRENAEYYKMFIDVNPGGGVRRNPKRKNAGAYSTPANFVPPSDAEIDKVFESHLQSMARGGTYGDNMEITAFSSAFEVDVKIYQRDFAFMVSGAGPTGEGHERPVAHIAYHVWEHYSSIRNADGPHTGLPKISPKVLTAEEEARQQEKLANTPYVLPWMIELVLTSVPWMALDVPTAKRALEATKGNVNDAVSNLMEREEYGSGSSAQESSSVERDQDSDDDVHNGPNKKQDRRMSKASKKDKPRLQEKKHVLSHLQTVNDSQESDTGSSWGDSEASSLPDSSQHSTMGTCDSTKPVLPINPDSASRSASPAKPPIKLKLHGPKPPPNHIPKKPPGKTSANQIGPRISARDKKDLSKRAQKAAHKERQKADAAAKQGGTSSKPAVTGLDLQAETKQTPPPVTGLRTLYI